MDLLGHGKLRTCPNRDAEQKFNLRVGKSVRAVLIRSHGDRNPCQPLVLLFYHHFIIGISVQLPHTELFTSAIKKSLFVEQTKVPTLFGCVLRETNIEET